MASGGPKGINWIAVRTAYVVKGWSAQQCALEFGVDPTTIKKRASKEGWTAERHRNTTEATKVATDEAAKLVHAIADTHLALISASAGLITDLIGDVRAMSPGRSRVEAGARVLEMIDRQSKMERTAKGLRDGEASIDTDESDDNSVRIVRTVVPAPERVANGA